MGKETAIKCHGVAAVSRAKAFADRHVRVIAVGADTFGRAFAVASCGEILDYRLGTERAAESLAVQLRHVVTRAIEAYETDPDTMSGGVGKVGRIGR